MFREENIVIEADLVALSRLLYVLEKVALREGITYHSYILPILERDSLTYELRPNIDRIQVVVPRRLYRKVVERVVKSDVIQSIVDGEYEV